MGLEKPREGTAGVIGTNAEVHFFEQDQANALPMDSTVLEAMEEAGRKTDIVYEQVRALLDAWGVAPGARAELVARASRHDIGARTAAGAALSQDAHVTSATFGRAMTARVERRMMESVPGVRAAVEQQRAELEEYLAQ